MLTFYPLYFNLSKVETQKLNAFITKAKTAINENNTEYKNELFCVELESDKVTISYQYAPDRVGKLVSLKHTDNSLLHGVKDLKATLKQLKRT